MEKIEFAKDIQIKESGSYRIDLNTEIIDFTITVNKNVVCSLFINYDNCKKSTLNLICDEYSQSNIVIWNHCENTVNLSDTINIGEAAICNLSYAECTLHDVFRNVDVHLNGVGAATKLHTATLSKDEKIFDVSVHHHAKQTLSSMKNFIVLLENGSCSMDAIGEIDQGASTSKSHQISRCLTFDQQHRAKITPQLLIDENDVEASHAMTLGQIDENQLYYLQSRGLTKSEVTRLIAYGYLLPIVEEINDENLKNLCKEEIQKKVSQICSI